MRNPYTQRESTYTYLRGFIGLYLLTLWHKDKIRKWASQKL